MPSWRVADGRGVVVSACDPGPLVLPGAQASRPAAMRRFEVLRRKRDFDVVYEQGRRLVSPLFVAFVLPTGTGRLRIAVVASRRVGGAVQRNRAKRLLREVYRRHVPQGEISADIVLVARGPLPRAAFRDVEEAYTRRVGRWFEKISGASGQAG